VFSDLSQEYGDKSGFAVLQHPFFNHDLLALSPLLFFLGTRHRTMLINIIRRFFLAY
jgi:hypothetical protein